MAEADEKFFKDVAKELNKIKKLKTEVKTGASNIVWLEAEGEDLSDLTFELNASLAIKSHQKIKILLNVDHVMHGRSGQEIPLSIGLATPKAVAEVVATYAHLK